MIRDEEEAASMRRWRGLVKRSMMVADEWRGIAAYCCTQDDGGW